MRGPALRWAAWIGGGVLAVYALMAGDLWLRARDSYLEGEKYMRWHANPAEKAASLEQKFLKDKAELDRLLAQKSLSQDDYRERLELLVFDKDESLKESSVKYAYIWYQSAVELFSPPESKWVKLARQKMPRALELWKEELRAKKIPFEDYMLE